MSRIRAATVSDLAAICAIVNVEIESSTTTFDTELWSVGARAAWLAAHDQAAHPLLVAEAEEIDGWAALSVWSPKAGYRRTVELSVFVREAARRSGVARELVAELVERARVAGHRTILARIEVGNEPSRRLLGHAGFRSVGIMHEVGEKLGRVLDVELLERLLGE